MPCYLFVYGARSSRQALDDQWGKSCLYRYFTGFVEVDLSPGIAPDIQNSNNSFRS
jgi:hypothetical protein